MLSRYTFHVVSSCDVSLAATVTLRWPALAITQVLSQAKPPVSNLSGTNNVCWWCFFLKDTPQLHFGAIFNSSKGDIKPSPSGKLWCDGQLEACTECTAGWQRSEGCVFQQKAENIESLHQMTTRYYLQKEDDDEEDAIGSEEDPGLFESATVAKDGDDEDESADGNEDISGLLYHCWLDKVLGGRDVVTS